MLDKCDYLPYIYVCVYMYIYIYIYIYDYILLSIMIYPLPLSFLSTLYLRSTHQFIFASPLANLYFFDHLNQWVVGPIYSIFINRGCFYGDMGRISFVEIGIALQQVENKKNEKDPRNRKKNFFISS